MRDIKQVRDQYEAALKKNPDDIKAKQLACKEDLRYLCRDILGMKDWDIVHDDIQEFMDGIITDPKERKEYGRQYKLVLIPRGHLKSSVITKAWSIQQVLRNPNIRILLANAVWDNSRRFLSSIQSWLTTKSELPKIFGDFKMAGKNASGWSRDELMVSQRTIVQDAKTITTTGVGAVQTGQHFDIIILDDVVERENSRTKEQRNKVREFYYDCLSLLEPDGIIMVVGTTWSEDDLYNTLKNDVNYKDNIFIRVAEQGTEESVIFKKKFTLKTLYDIKGTTPEKRKHYSAQYLMNPYPDEDMEFKKHWIRYYDKLPGVPMYVSMTLDPSLGKDTSDYSAIVTCGRTEERQTFVLEARHFRRAVELIPEEVVRSVSQLKAMGYMPSVIGLESYGFQQSLQKPIKDALAKAGFPVYVELLPRIVTEDKAARIRKLIPKFAAYEILISPAHEDLVNELMRFDPERMGKSDDIIDALAWQIHYWDRRSVAKQQVSKKEFTFQWWMDRAIRADEGDGYFQEFK